ncbi:MAG: amino acid transporter [Planctomyces sp.]|nr:amino acid transporter [Planctomyces sp.]
MRDPEGEKPFDVLTLTLLVIASMIGAGVYTTSGFALADLRDPWLVLLAWTVGGFIAVCGAVGYAQLAERLTENGGEYLYLSRFAHPAAGFSAGWVSFLAGFTGAGAYAAVAFETYLLPEEFRSDWLPAKSPALMLVVAATLSHAFNSRYGARSQNGIVVCKLGLLAALLLYAFFRIGSWQGGESLPGDESNSHVTVLSFATSVMWISLSYCGFNAAIYVAGEARDGSKSIRRAMVLGTVVVTVIYLLLNAFIVFAPRPEQIAGEPDVAAIAARSVGGNALEVITRGAICLGLASSVSSVLMSGPRVYAKMAADGYFPRFFASTQSPPVRSVFLQGIAIMLVISISTLQGLLSYLGMTLALSAAATVSTLFIGSWDRSNLVDRVLRGMALIFVLATLLIAGLAAWNKPIEGIAALVTLCVGGVVYLLTRHDHISGES